MRFDGERLTINAFAPAPRRRGISGLDDKVGNDAVEDEVVVESLERKGEEIATCLRCFAGKEFDLDFAFRGNEQDAARCRRFGDVLRRHDGMV